jgi:hypothetical protein
MFAGQPYADKDDSCGRDGCLLHRARGGRLDYVRCSVANRAVRMRQPIRMKVRLLNAGADEKKEGTHDGKQEMPAHLGRTMLCHFSHLYPKIIRHFSCDFEWR